MTARCECEHAAHFGAEGAVLTPNGNPGHTYGASFAPVAIQMVRTIYGTFEVCPDCANDCLAQKAIIVEVPK